jgi:ketosteroid isomerase-like protein
MRTILLSLLLLPLTLQAQTEADILQIVDRFFKAMADRDTTTLQAIMTTDGVFYAVPIGSEKGPRAVTHKQFISDMGKGTEKLIERYWEPQVWIGDDIATVRAEYDFHVDGKFSHCGTDVFNFIRVGDGWKMCGGLFNMKREGCLESPLGPLDK